MRRACLGWLGLAAALGCGAEPRVAQDAGVPAPDAGWVDRDQDWLCDSTELRFETDPLVADADGDWLPDGLEAQFGTDPLDAAFPARSEVVFLRAELGAQAETVVYVTVDGDNQAFAGELLAWPSLEPGWPDVGAYFVEATADSADPPDHVFGFPDNGDRIGSVIGVTRIGYRLRFGFAGDADLSCSQLVTLTYSLKRQDGVRFGDRVMFLVVSNHDTTPTWCPTQHCL